jgi:hypothetical protein
MANRQIILFPPKPRRKGELVAEWKNEWTGENEKVWLKWPGPRAGESNEVHGLALSFERRAPEEPLTTELSLAGFLRWFNKRNANSNAAGSGQFQWSGDSLANVLEASARQLDRAASSFRKGAS